MADLEGDLSSWLEGAERLERRRSADKVSIPRVGRRVRFNVAQRRGKDVLEGEGDGAQCSTARISKEEAVEDDCEVKEDEAEDEGSVSIWGNALRESLLAPVLMLNKPDRLLLSSFSGIGASNGGVQEGEET